MSDDPHLPLFLLAVDNASKAWEAGFSIVAKRLNAVLTLRAPGLQIKAAEPQSGAPLNMLECRQRLLHAMPFIRLAAPDEPPDDKLTPWILGNANGLGEPPIPVGGYLYGFEDSIETVTDMLLEREWSDREWKELIVDPVESHAEQVRQWFQSLQKKSSNQHGEPSPFDSAAPGKWGLLLSYYDHMRPDPYAKIVNRYNQHRGKHPAATVPDLYSAVAERERKGKRGKVTSASAKNGSAASYGTRAKKRP